jgi:hypothetical protein
MSTMTLGTVPDRRAAEHQLVHAWRAEQLGRLGVPRLHAEVYADLVDWHAIADLVGRGCSPTPALKIVH